MPAEHSKTLLPLPVKPESARQLPSAAVPEIPPVPEFDGQAVQSSEPEATLNVFAEHATHDPDVPVDPVGQLGVHPPSAAVPELPPVPEFDGQAVQPAEPATALNVSAMHADGVAPFGPVYPASATHAMLEVEPVLPSVAELLAQTSQAEADAPAAL